MKKLFAFAVVAAASQSHAIVVDSFQVGPYDSGIVTTVGPLVTATQVGPPAAIIGGIRETKIQLTQNTLGANGGTRMTVGGGFMAVSQSPLTDGQYSLFYGNPGNFLNLNLSNESAFRFTLAFNDLAPLRLNMRVGTNGSGASNAFINLPVVTGPAQTVIVPFASFAGLASFSDVDSIRMFFDTEVAGDFVIGQIETVPEPGTIAALGLGALFLLRRKKA